MKKSFYLYIIFFLLLRQTVAGQIDDVKFQQISPPGGFTLKSINAIVQDDFGFVWMATNRGLLRYDSERPKWFLPKENDPGSISGRIISDLYAEGNIIWVSTNKGLCLYNYKKQNFERINLVYENGHRINEGSFSLLKIEGNNYFAINQDCFGKLDLNTNIFQRIKKELIKSPVVLHKDHKNILWIATATGSVFRYSPSDKTVEKVISGTGQLINTVYVDNEHIWVGYDNDGAKKYDFDGKTVAHYRTDKKNDLFTRVRKILKDTYGRLWFGTYEGLFAFDGQEFSAFNNESHPGLPFNSIYEIYEGKQGVIWIGTWSGGVSIIHHSYSDLQTFRHSKLFNSVSNNTISSFLQIGENEILVGTENGGLNKFNTLSKQFEQVPLLNDMKIKNIKSLCKDNDGGLWVGCFRNGLLYRPKGSPDFQQFTIGPPDGKHISASSVYAMCAVDSGVWVGTYPSGLDFYNFNSQSFSYYFQYNNKLDWLNLDTQCIYADSESNLWLGTSHGLYRIHIPTRQISKIKIDSTVGFFADNSISIFQVWQHSTGDLWLGTRNHGIIVYNTQTENSKLLNLNGLLKNKDIYGIIQDTNETIWITTNKGLVSYNQKLGISRLFDHNDQIQSDMFCPNSIYKDSAGRLYFGGNNGFTTINSSDIRINRRKPNTIIKSLIIKNDSTIYPDYDNESRAKKITLNPEETTLRIHFAADNYLVSEKNRYQYRLINYYDQWVDNGSNGSVLFTNLDAGSYVFEVKACNNDGFWNDTPTRIEIKINRFWYQTTLAYLLYFLLFLLTGYIVRHFYLKSIKLKQAIAIEIDQRKNAEHVNEMKLKFFTNISHEIRTPLALITWPINNLIHSKNISEEERKELEIVRHNTNRLLRQVNQIIDFRKLESEKTKLSISKFDVVSFVLELHKGFLSEEKKKGIKFSFTSEVEELQLEADKEKLDVIFYNLLSNSYKFIDNSNEVQVYINQSLTLPFKHYDNQISFGELTGNDIVEIKIEDTGIGIDQTDLMSIFNRFQQGKKEKQKQVKGSGIGLSLCKDYVLLHGGKIIAQSSAGAGSCFTILLPRTQGANYMVDDSNKKYYDTAAPETTTPEAENEDKGENTKRILVVEDNDDFRYFISNCLKKNYYVTEATNGKEALSKLKTENIDLIVSDVMMPEMDGYEFCGIVKSEISTSHIPVILLTALSASTNVVTGLDKGADAYITKPFEEAVLQKQVNNILEQRQRIQENFKKNFVSKEALEVGNLDNFFLNRVKTAIEANLNEEDFDMEKLAKELMISRTHLHRKIKSIAGMTTSEFVNMVRVKKAVELIKKENFLFNEVAYRVGFSSQSYFNKCFKKVYDVTPKEYFS